MISSRYYGFWSTAYLWFLRASEAFKDQSTPRRQITHIQVNTNENHSWIQQIFQLWLYLLSIQIRSNIKIHYIKKLVRTPLNVYFTAFKSIFLSLSLCTYYLVWMSCLISFERCQSSCEEHGTSQHYKQFLSTVGFEPPTPHPLISSVSI